MSNSLLENQNVERTTVYLTPRNKQRLAQLRRGEKTRAINAALDHAFEAQERQRAFGEMMAVFDVPFIFF